MGEAPAYQPYNESAVAEAERSIPVCLNFTSFGGFVVVYDLL